MINPLLDINKYKDIYNSKKIVVIKDFLSQDIAGKIYKYLHFQKKKKSWMYSNCYDNKKSDLQNKDSKIKAIIMHQKKANMAFNMDKFSFSFERTLNSTGKKKLKPNIEDFTKFLFTQDKMIETINAITDENITNAHDIFMSKYSYGNFLSPHSDKNNGRIAFVLNLSYGWKPQYGGLLHIMNQERDEVIKTITPQYNSLVLFYIPEETGIPHFVSHVNIRNRNRYAITGWFS